MSGMERGPWYHWNPLAEVRARGRLVGADAPTAAGAETLYNVGKRALEHPARSPGQVASRPDEKLLA